MVQTSIKHSTLLGSDIRNQNLRTLRRTLHELQVATISQLRERTGLSVVTLNKLVAALIESGEIIEGGTQHAAAGRPAKTYQFNASHQLLLIVSCYQRAGHDYAGYSVHNLFGECLERREELLSTIHTDEFRIGIERYLERYRRIATIGISMPTDTVGGRMASAIRHDPQSKRLAHHLQQHFQVPVFFETDINAATLGCFNRSDQDYVTGLVLVPGRAPACGFCYKGDLIRGKDGLAGEVRFFPMYNEQGVLPEEPLQADELAIRTLRALMCVLNPELVEIYTENLRPGLIERFKKRIASVAEQALIPQIELNPRIRDDIVSGMVTLCLDALSNVVPRPRQP